MKHKKPFVLGLTGNIGMGKSTTARIFRRLNVPVHDADKIVHDLLKKNGKAVKPIARIFPGSFKRGAINRRALGNIVFGNKLLLKKLEAIIHPLVRREEQKFLAKAHRAKAKYVVLDIPLLFETKAHKRCDGVICVTAPKALQQQRVLQRKGMNLAKFKAIKSHQLSDTIKRSLADYVVVTDKGLADTRQQILTILSLIDEDNQQNA